MQLHLSSTTLHHPPKNGKKFAASLLPKLIDIVEGKLSVKRVVNQAVRSTAKKWWRTSHKKNRAFLEN